MPRLPDPASRRRAGARGHGLHPSVAAKPRENMGRLWARYGGRGSSRARHTRPASRAGDRGQGHSARRHDPPAPGPRLGDVRVPQLDLRDLRRGVARGDHGPAPAAARLPAGALRLLFDYRTLSYGARASPRTRPSAAPSTCSATARAPRLHAWAHARATSSVIAHLRDRDFVIAGDAIYTYGQLGDAPEPPRPLDRHTWRRSRQELALFHRSYPQAMIVPATTRSTGGRWDPKYE